MYYFENTEQLPHPNPSNTGISHQNTSLYGISQDSHPSQLGMNPPNMHVHV